MKIIIRVDGYNRIGLGHIYRTTALAHHLSNHHILFVSKKMHKLGINFIKSQNFNIKTFTLKKEFYEIIANFEPDIIFNDILDTSADYIEYLKGKNLFTVNFEDLGDGSTKADIVFNALYEQKNSLDNYYWGKNYYILREEFQDIEQKTIEKEVKQILITFGGTDPNNYTKKVLELLNNMDLKNIKISIVLGLGYAKYDDLIKYSQELNHKFMIKKNVKNISALMYDADLIFTSAGRTVYEIASIGVPTIVLAQNDRELLHTFADKKNGFLNLGLGYKVSNEKIKKLITLLINDYDFRKKLSCLMLNQNLKSGIDNVIDLIFKTYENFRKEVE